MDVGSPLRPPSSHPKSDTGRKAPSFKLPSRKGALGSIYVLAVIASLFLLLISPVFIFSSPKFIFIYGAVRKACAYDKADVHQKSQTFAFEDVQAIQEDDFITVDGLWLRDSKGYPHFIQGMNYWSCMNMAADDHAGGNLTRLKEEMDQMAAVGINHLRIFAATEGDHQRQPFRILPALHVSPGEWDERIFTGLDRCIAEAGRRKMRITMVMGNTWQWTGGNAQLIRWVEGTRIPYPRSWGINLPPQRNDGFPGWGNWSDGDGDRFVNYQGLFFRSRAAQHIYEKHLEKILERRNTVTQRLYKNDPIILAWEPVNEPTAASEDPIDIAAMRQWYDRTTSLIRKRGAKQLITTGYEAKQTEKEYIDLHNLPAVDYGCAHMWPQIWGYYDMLNSSKANVQAAIDFAHDYILKVQRYAQLVGKPILLEELGMPRDVWVNNVSAANVYQYDTRAPTTSRDALFSAVFDLVSAQFKNRKGLVGVAPWSYGGSYRSSVQQMNNQGVILSGDPPQEPPGWHSILDFDETMSLISDMNADMSVFLSSLPSEPVTNK